jgi:hypothetical protein
MMADGSLLRSGGATWGPVSPDNVDETGVSPLDILDSPSWPPRRSRSSKLQVRTWSRARSKVLVPYRVITAGSAAGSQ